MRTWTTEFRFVIATGRIEMRQRNLKTGAVRILAQGVEDLLPVMKPKSKPLPVPWWFRNISTELMRAVVEAECGGRA